MRIGALAEQTGASVRSLRYYEERGLLAATRTPSGQRAYEHESIERVRLLRQLFAAGLSSATIASLLPCVDRPSVESTHESMALMRREHDRLTDQITELRATRAQLAALIESASACSATHAEATAG